MILNLVASDCPNANIVCTWGLGTHPVFLLFGIGTCAYQEFVMHQTALQECHRLPWPRGWPPGAVASATARGSGP